MTIVKFEDPKHEAVYQTLRAVGCTMLQAVEGVFDRLDRQNG